jgi:hypothetical protein
MVRIMSRQLCVPKKLSDKFKVQSDLFFRSDIQKGAMEALVMTLTLRLRRSSRHCGDASTPENSARVDPSIPLEERSRLGSTVVRAGMAVLSMTMRDNLSVLHVVWVSK